MLLFNVLYAAHARGTHHKLALDALLHLSGPEAEAWQRVFLKHAAVYMSGSKAPDDEFKDFKNHVLHVRDGYWGGATGKARNWYQHLVDGLAAKDWERAVYAAGVLSHYYTDPIHPFHTAQSEAENALHRAVEWSINRSYDALRKDGVVKYSNLTIDVPKGETWLADMVCRGAETSNVHYEKLMAHYDLKAGVVDPPAGLDETARDIISHLLMYAAKGFAAILERAFAEAGVTPPDVSLSLETIVATLQIPLKALLKKIDDAATRKQVEAMYDELMATGKVDATLPEDDRMVRDLYKAEVLAPREKQLTAQRAARLLPIPTAVAGVRADAVTGRKSKKPLAPPAAPATGGTVEAPKRQTTAIVHDEPTVITSPLANREPAVPLTSVAPPVLDEATDTVIPTPVRELASLKRQPRILISETDDLERAPSIGPAMAQKFAELGVMTIGDFLDQEPRDLAEVLDDPRYGTNVMMAWQDQSRLMLVVPGLTGTGAQLLVGAGFRSLSVLQAVDTATLTSAVLQYASTGHGRRILRDGAPPDIEKINDWIESARSQKAA